MELCRSLVAPRDLRTDLGERLQGFRNGIDIEQRQINAELYCTLSLCIEARQRETGFQWLWHATGTTRTRGAEAGRRLFNVSRKSWCCLRLERQLSTGT